VFTNSLGEIQTHISVHYHTLLYL